MTELIAYAVFIFALGGSVWAVADACLKVANALRAPRFYPSGQANKLSCRFAWQLLSQGEDG